MEVLFAYCEEVESTVPARERTVEDVCGGHERGVLNPRDRRHVMAQLSAEGHKRVESFLFEQVFLQKATAALGEEHVSVGWSFVYGSEQEDVPQYWFKLNDPTKGWNEVDDLVADLLSNSGCDVTSVAYYPEDGLFQAQRYDDGRWLERRALREALREITGSASPRTRVRNYSYINRDAQSIAINAIDSIFSDEELYLLSLSRTLTNCYVYPWFAKQPMDLDLCYVVGDHLRFVEFKRKYPAKSGEFGIDEHPHGVLSDWLEDAGTALLHVVLCDPMWDKSVSPTHMLAAG
ncbi:MAG: hypothetical protein AVDCRST_MAG93-1243, partial [uncultured Chloroflexia bacterium]